MRNWLHIENIKRLWNNLKSLTIKSDNKMVEIKKLWNIETFFDPNIFLEFIKKGDFSSDWDIFKANINLVLNEDTDDIDEINFYIIAKDNNKEVFLTSDIDISKTNLSYNFELYPYTEEYWIWKKSFWSISFEYWNIRLLNFNKDMLVEWILEYIYDLYQVD